MAALYMQATLIIKNDKQKRVLKSGASNIQIWSWTERMINQVGVIIAG